MKKSTATERSVTKYFAKSSSAPTDNELSVAASDAPSYQQIKSLLLKTLEENYRDKLELDCIKFAEYSKIYAQNSFSLKIERINREIEKNKKIIEKIEKNKKNNFSKIKIKNLKNKIFDLEIELKKSNYQISEAENFIKNFKKGEFELFTFLENYQLLKIVAVSNFSNLFLSFDAKILDFVVLKILKNDFLENENLIKNFENEIFLLKNLNHEKIIKICNEISHPKNSKIKIPIFKFYKNFSLKNFLAEKIILSENEALFYAKQIIKILIYFEKDLKNQFSEHFLVHFDLKPENFLLDENFDLILIDFNLAKTFKKASKIILKSNFKIGTKFYIAPEIFTENPEISTKIDIYSFGVIFYQFLYHKIDEFDFDDEFRKSLNHREISPETKFFIKKCLSKNQNDRPFASEALNFLCFKNLNKMEI